MLNYIGVSMVNQSGGLEGLGAPLIRPPTSHYIGGPESVKILRSQVNWPCRIKLNQMATATGGYVPARGGYVTGNRKLCASNMRLCASTRRLCGSNRSLCEGN